tara:strand:+ start:875 stop:1099 length:225 start_codon:yes stop_codon:yes gene_type:complete
MGKQVQTDDPRFVRDIESRALLNTDHNALQQHRREKVYFENQQKDINIMKVQIEHLTKVTKEMLEIKTLLRNFK